MPVTSGMFTRCRKCEGEIKGGDTCYSEQIASGTSVDVKPLICVDCAEKMAPE